MVGPAAGVATLRLGVSSSPPISRTREVGTTAHRFISDAGSLGQDGWKTAGTKLPQRELPVEQDQSLVTGIRQRGDRPLKQPTDKASCSRVDWTSATPHAPVPQRRETRAPAKECGRTSKGWWLGPFFFHAIAVSFNHHRPPHDASADRSRPWPGYCPHPTGKADFL